MGHESPFTFMSSLHTLDLSNNEIEVLPNHLFLQLSGLRAEHITQQNGDAVARYSRTTYSPAHHRRLHEPARVRLQPQVVEKKTGKQNPRAIRTGRSLYESTLLQRHSDRRHTTVEVQL